MIHNKTEFVIKNLNKEKIFKQIIKIADISDIKIDNNQIKFSVCKKHENTVQKLLENNNAGITNKREKGFLYFLKKTILKLGIITPIVLFFVFFVFLNNYILKFEINGTKNISISQIKKVLQQNDINKFTNKSRINILELEQDIQKISEVSLVSVIIKGNTLIINIKEKLLNEEYENKDNFTPILSLYNGVITELSIIQGTPLVKIGQTVKAGQPLVSPYIIDTSGNKLMVKPLAEIKADVFFTYEQDIPNIKIQLVPTGNKYSEKSLKWNGVYLYGSNTYCKYKHYKTETKSQYLLGSSVFPITIEKTTYIELKEDVIENYFENNKEIILKEISAKTKLLFSADEQIKEEYHSITSAAQNYKIINTCVINRSIVQ